MLFKARFVTILMLVVSSFLCSYSMEGNAMIKGYYCEITDSKVIIAPGEGRTISDKEIIKLESVLADTNRTIHCIGVNFTSLEMRQIVEVLINRRFENISLESCENYDILVSNISPEAGKALAAALANDTKLTYFDLSDKNIGPEDAKVFAAVLAKNTTLKEIFLNDNHIGAEGAKALATALATNTTLTILHVSNSDIGAEGVKDLAALLSKNTALKDIWLDNNHIDDDGAKVLAAALAENTKLTSLNLSDNDIGPKGVKELAEALAKNTTLNNISLENNYIRSEGAKELAAALAKNTTLKWIWLEKNKIGTEGAKELAEALAKNTTLKKIWLGKNKIGAEGAKELAAALAKNKLLSLDDLDLSHNNIGDVGAIALAAYLAANTTLTRLDVSHNHISDEGAKEFAVALATNTTLTSLDVSNNDISHEGAIAFVAALAKNTTLSRLRLEENNIGYRGGKEFAAVLAKSITLTRISIYCRNIDAAEEEMIKKILERNELLEKLKQTFLNRILFSKAFLGKDAEIFLPDDMIGEIIEKGEAEFFYNLLMFAGEKFFAKAVKAGLLTKDDCKRINRIREFGAERIQSFSPSASATASTSSSTVEQNSLYIPKQLNIGAISDLAGILTQKEAKSAISVSSSASTSTSASSLSDDASKARELLYYTKNQSLTKVIEELLEAKKKFLENIFARYIAGIRNAYQEQGDVLWGGDLELGRIADILHLNIIVHRYAYNTDAPAPARGGIRPGRIIGTTPIAPGYTNAIHLWYDGFHYNSADENGNMIFGQVPGDGNCLFHAIIMATDPSHNSSLEQVTELRNRVADALQNEVDTILPHQQLTLNPIVARFNAIIEARNMHVFREALAALPIGRLRNEAEELHFRLQDAENQLQEFTEAQANERSLPASAASSSMISTTASSSTLTNTTPLPATVPPNNTTLPFFANHDHGVLQTSQPALSRMINNAQVVEQNNINDRPFLILPDSHLR